MRACTRPTLLDLPIGPRSCYRCDGKFHRGSCERDSRIEEETGWTVRGGGSRRQTRNRKRLGIRLAEHRHQRTEGRAAQERPEQSPLAWRASSVSVTGRRRFVLRLQPRTCVVQVRPAQSGWCRTNRRRPGAAQAQSSGLLKMQVYRSGRETQLGCLQS